MMFRANGGCVLLATISFVLIVLVNYDQEKFLSNFFFIIFFKIGR